MFDGVRTKVRSGLANGSFLLAVIGGFLASVSMIGGWLNNIVGVGPWYTPVAAFMVLFMVCLGDWASDNVPNRPAVYTAMLWPSFLVGSLTGEPGAKLFSAIGAISKSTAAGMKSGVIKWTDLPGTLEDAFTVFSLICIVGAVTYAQRYAEKKKKSTGTTAQPVAVSRRAGR